MRNEGAQQQPERSTTMRIEPCPSCGEPKPEDTGAPQPCFRCRSKGSTFTVATVQQLDTLRDALERIARGADSRFDMLQIARDALDSAQLVGQQQQPSEPRMVERRFVESAVSPIVNDAFKRARENHMLVYGASPNLPDAKPFITAIIRTLQSLGVNIRADEALRVEGPEKEQEQ